MSKFEKELQEIMTDMICAFKSEHPGASYMSMTFSGAKYASVTWVEGGITREMRWGVGEDGHPRD